jgi:hypothetical protein
MSADDLRPARVDVPFIAWTLAAFHERGAA